MMTVEISEQIRCKQANKVTLVGFTANLCLTLLKLAAGIFGHSGAMIADAVHSLSDFATDIVVLVSFHFVKQPPDKDHDYGHGKFETFATTLIGAALFFVGSGIFYSAAKNIYALTLLHQQIESPELIALAAAFVSIISKELLYRYTVITGKRINSQALIANAWHHRSDAFSSIGTLIGIGGAILLGERWRILDPIAALAVSFFIIKTAYEIASGSIRELLEESLDEQTEKDIMEVITANKAVIDPHNLKTRKHGDRFIIDVHVRVDNDMSVYDAHIVNNEIEHSLKSKFGSKTIINIHTEPEKE